MPRPNKARSIASERALGRRVAVERERRGWSYDGLASRMSIAGCAINASAIYKIEKSDPPRRITVDELVGFSQAFGLPVEELLMPPEVAANARLAELAGAWQAAYLRYWTAGQETGEAWDALREYVMSDAVSDEAVQVLGEAFGDVFHGDADPLERDLEVARFLAQITDADEWKRRQRDLTRELVDRTDLG